MTVFAYTRISTGQQDLDGQRLQVLEFARKHDLKVDRFIEATISSRKNAKDRRIDELNESLSPGDTLLVAELSRLGRSVGQVTTMVDELISKRVKLICIKENIWLDGDGKKDIQTTVLTSTFSMLAEVERQLISERTKAGLQAARARGKLLGRPKGAGRSRLDEHKEAIIEDLKRGVPKAKVARRYKTSPANLYNWINKHGLSQLKEY